ncbi:T9SS type A sorting domain-containing protein [Pukyongia salina]|nr:T9SS type A sorting domain-containing protein [Pukyongia salina]
MKSIRFILLFCLLSFGVYAQDPPSELFNSWYYIGSEGDLVGFTPISVQPPFNPLLVIQSDLSFQGTGACNTCSGIFEFDPVENTLEVIQFQRTFNQCQYQSHTDLDNDFFSWLELPDFQPYPIQFLSNTKLELVSFNGFGPHYSTTPWLSAGDTHLEDIKVYPNPVEHILMIRSINVEFNYEIYDVNGRMVTSGKSTNSGIEVGKLDSGTYFIKLFIEDLTHTIRFIKK